MKAIGLAALVLAFGAALIVLSQATAQTPPPTTCNPPLSRGPGGQTITAGRIYVELVPGYNYLWNAPAEGTRGGTLVICVIEYSAQISINADNGAEISRNAPVVSAAPVLDLIAASARLIAPPTPTPAPTLAPSAALQQGTSGNIRPPNTGDAGLR